MSESKRTKKFAYLWTSPDRSEQGWKFVKAIDLEDAKKEAEKNCPRGMRVGIVERA